MNDKKIIKIGLIVSCIILILIWTPFTYYFIFMGWFRGFFITQVSLLIFGCISVVLLLLPNKK